MPPKYTHLSQRNQILKRPGQHIGSTKTTVKPVWVSIEDDDGEHIVEQEIGHNPGLIHIFYEVLGNAQDNYFRSKGSEAPLKKIDVDVDIESGLISVWNDGLWIPARVHKWSAEEEVIDDADHYEAEIIFGNLNSSSNYDDEDVKRTGGGLHGVGVKLTNIFSTSFTVTAHDPESGLKFVGEWADNMSKLVSAKVLKCKMKTGFTKVSYTADFARFGVQGYNEDHLAVMKKLCLDCAMITGQKVVFNGEVLPVKNLLSYSNLFADCKKIQFESADSTVVLCEKPAYEAGIFQMSWVNGINTSRGGIHVDEWKKAIFKPLLEKLRNKFSSGRGSTPLRLTPKSLEQYFMLFVNCNLENPEFEGQTKGVLATPAPIVNVPASKITAMMKWDFITDIEETVKIQGMKELKKTDGKKTTSIHITNADDANKAGTVKSHECTLFVTEGLSAKNFAVKGISTIQNGTDWYGILPLRGVIKNVRGATVNQINDNKEITELKKILGLQHGMDYSDDKNFSTLRYGKVRVLTDADEDGNHIKGLIINFFHYFYPSLIERGYITSLRTPIVKVYKGRKVLTFYYLKKFREWMEKQSDDNYKVKYYKGLGTTLDDDIFEIFSAPRYVKFVDDKDAGDTISLIFNKKRADDRKKWLEDYEETEFIYDQIDAEEQVPVSKFFNNEMITFSIYDNQRSIPSVVDGLKPSQRKAIWVGLKVLNEKDDYKVAEFISEVTKRSKYHHGDTSMEGAIIGMAQTFVGANNIALFMERGQFGGRNAGGKDASASRYIYTRLPNITRFIFRKEDDPILEYLEEDGASIEPRYFVPIIPMLLVNGCKGIGTGYASRIPAFNPIDLIKWIRAWLSDEEKPELKPWYRGFKGVVEKDGEKKFINYGLYNEVGKDCYEITELPIGTWTDDYKEVLNDLKNNGSVQTGYEGMKVGELKEMLGERELPVSGTKAALVARLKAADKEAGVKKGGNGLISKWEWYGDAYNVHFKVWTKPGVSIDYDNTKFKLTGSHTLTNMTAFTPKGGIKQYDCLTDILETFCTVRYEYYERRKKHLLRVLKERLAELESKNRYIQFVMKDFNVLRQTESELFDYLKKEKYYSRKEGEDSGYRYLTSIQTRAFTTDHYKKLLKQIDEVQEEIAYVKEKTPKGMWLAELAAFETAYEKWCVEIGNMEKTLAKKKFKRRG